MAEDAFGTTRVGVVVDKFDMNQDRMHLDTVFNIASPTLCVMVGVDVGFLLYLMLDLSTPPPP